MSETPRDDYRPKKQNATLESLLRAIALKALKRDSDLNGRLARLLRKPSQVADCPELSEDDPLRRDARIISEDFEAATNGMGSPPILLPPFPSIDEDPFAAWKILIEAIRRFYAGDSKGILEASTAIPEDTPPAHFRPVLERLAGRPASGSWEDHLADTLFSKSPILLEALELLQESAPYPEFLIKELARALPILHEESPESATRTALWGMGILAEEAPLEENDLNPFLQTLGPAETYRLAALVSLDWDPEKALLYWVKSFSERCLRGGFDSRDAAAFLSLGAQMGREALANESITGEILSRIHGELSPLAPLVASMLPSAPSFPLSAGDVFSWMAESGRYPLPGGRSTTVSIRKRPPMETLSLFGEQEEGA